ncbi:MAG: hypothetical protein A6D92_08380 [Symbiobacterium thermophilum]|uniref:Uncharacterized protein n=1 Tax=Symbiobacterium thermophilum TaxID=2734 RepID=A0A1Y2T4F7_SYMTR|nr:MAG: hypothetical protein A6D92_08380 [Symbiobacterium thermophilum]
MVRAVLEVARRHGKYILDSMTTENTVVPRTAVEMGVPCVQRSLFLDHENGKDVVVSQLYKLAEWAETHGAAIGIGHVGVGREGTAARWRRCCPNWRRGGSGWSPFRNCSPISRKISQFRSNHSRARQDPNLREAASGAPAHRTEEV